MDKGRALTLSQPHISLACDSNIVAVASMNNVVDVSLITPVKKDSLITSCEKVSMTDGVDRIILISKANSQVIEAEINNQPEKFTSDGRGFWVIGEIYRHRDNIKFRYLSEYILNEESLSKYLRTEDCKPQLMQALSYQHDAISDMGNGAKGVVQELKNKDFSAAGSQAKKLSEKALNEGFSIFKRLKGKTSNKVLQIKNKDFLNAITAAGALVAFADGFASEGELNKVIQFIANSKDLNVFPLEEVHYSFTEYISQLRKNKFIGEGTAFSVIGKYEGKDESELIIALSVAVASAEGGIDSAELAMINRIAKKLNSNASHYLT
jgi:tellurite resistance protein